MPLLASNWRNQQSLDDFLKQRNVVAIAELDTRRLTRVLRDKGSLNGCLLSGAALEKGGREKAIELAQQFPGLKGMDLAKIVSVNRSYSWEEAVWDIREGYLLPAESRFNVVAVSYTHLTLPTTPYV